jgi:formate dehydrogenase major subunit
MKAIPFKEPAELPDAEYPLIMTTGRVLQQFHTGTMTRKTQGLNNLAGPMVMISVEDAESLGVKNSDKVKVSTRRGEIVSNAFVTKRIGKGTIYIPFHYAEAPANLLTIAALDPVAKIPELKVCAARVARAS